MSGPSHARLSADDRLLDTDDQLAELNKRAGAEEDRLVLVPVLAIARLARRLGVLVARPVRLADEEEDVEVWVRARPEPDGSVRLTLADWRTRSPRAQRHEHPEPEQEAEAPLLPSQFAEPLRRALDRPIRRIVAIAETLHADENEEVPQTYRDYARDIVQAGRHLQALLEDLVTLNGVEEEAPAAEPLELGEVSRRAADLLTVRASDARVRVLVSGEQAFATGDFRRTLQIAVNLIGNAINHSPVDGQIDVTVSSGADARMIVDDEGPGVPPESRERVFGQFVRLEPNETPGSGLGLYISRRLVRAMGGELRVGDSPSGGARFTLTLPPV